MTDLLFGQEVRQAAGLSACGRYRYWLTRTWDNDKPVHAWLMLNPSVANAEIDDPTIKRCIRFSRDWGAGGIVVVNLFALRSTEPTVIYCRGADAVGPDNDAAIVRATDGRRVIAAWGCHGPYLGRDRQVMALLNNRQVECLGVTKEGHPKHPLYVAGATAPQPFELTGGAA